GPARAQDIPILLCPSDACQGRFNVVVNGITEGVGRTNYHASLGAHGWFRNPDGATGGVFFALGTAAAGPTGRGKGIRIGDILDGSSNPAMYAEVKRNQGTTSGVPESRPELILNQVPFGTWDGSQSANDQVPPPDCFNNSLGASSFSYTGSQYY